MSPLIITSCPLFTVKTLNELKLRNYFKCLILLPHWTEENWVQFFPLTHLILVKDAWNKIAIATATMSGSFLCLFSFISYSNYPLLSGGGGGPRSRLDCLSVEPRVPHQSITCKYLRTKLVCSWEMWFCFLVSKFSGVTIFAPCFVRKSK